MTTHDNTALVLRHIEDTFNNKGGSEAADRYWSDPVLNFSAELPRARLGKLFDELLGAFPDWHFTIDRIVAADDWAACAATMRGTYQAATIELIADVKPTGQAVEWRHTHWFRITDGRIAEHFAHRDDLGLRRQVLAVAS